MYTWQHIKVSKPLQKAKVSVVCVVLCKTQKASQLKEDPELLTVQRVSNVFSETKDPSRPKRNIDA